METGDPTMMTDIITDEPWRFVFGVFLVSDWRVWDWNALEFTQCECARSYARYL